MSGVWFDGDSDESGSDDAVVLVAFSVGDPRQAFEDDARGKKLSFRLCSRDGE